MQDGDRVRVAVGEYQGLAGTFIGEPGTKGVAVKLDKGNIVPIPYAVGAATADKLLEPIPGPPPTSNQEFGLSPQQS